MEGKIQKWGNSLAVRIPMYLADLLAIVEGTRVEIEVVDQSIRIKPVHPGKYRLEELLDQITPDNMHAAVDYGDAVGLEAL